MISGGMIHYPTPESVGQLYVHNMSKNVAVLLTQGLTQGLTDNTRTSIGVSSAAGGMYKCVGTNDKASQSSNVTIHVEEGISTLLTRRIKQSHY